ncbi:alpha/beta hydrolase [Agarivorans sp. Z349TD_8]|uniref:alpha/beta hydrolase n=1 Tax=Agarivorans sp. Z349TD_8 TaxID=3421434 RepID=UPI003D7E57B1
MRLIFISLLFLSLSGCSNKLFFSPSKPDTINPEVRWMKSRSGNDIAYLWLPRSQQLEPAGIIAHFHGNSGHMEQTKEKVDWLIEHGYDVMVFDYSGFGHSSGQVSDQAAYLDALSILDYFEQLALQSQQASFIIATSTGGNILMRALADNPIQIDGMIIDSSFSSYVEETKYILNKGKLSQLYAWLAGWLMRDDYASAESLSRLPGLNSLVIHCASDQVVPIEAGETIYQQLKGNKDFWRLESCAHARALTRDHPEHQQRIIRWLATSRESDTATLDQQFANNLN